MTSIGERDGGAELSSLLRAQDDPEQPVTRIELFFDLVFVFAVTQLSHTLLEHLDLRGAAQTLLLLVAVWRAWVDTAWVTNWFDPDRAAVRLVLFGIMLVSLVMSVALPEAFGDRGLVFAVAYLLIQVGRTSFSIAVLRGDSPLHRNFQRLLAWYALSGVFWIAGGLADGTARESCWLVAVVLDMVGPLAQFYTPGLGRSAVADWAISGGHLAERCQLFVIVALGESILVTGATVDAAGRSVATLAAFVIAFIGSVAFWWVYFYRSASYGAETITTARDPGRLGRSAYTYFHLPMVAGIIVAAVGDELTIAHPMDAVGPSTLAVLIGGPMLFLTGHLLFKWAVAGGWLRSHLAGLVALIALIPIGLAAPALATAALATAVVCAVAARDTWLLWRGRAGPDHPALLRADA